MIRYTILIISITAIYLSAFSQNSYFVFNYGKFNESTDVLLLGDNVNIRNSPSLNSKVVANLPIAHPLTIIENSEEKLTLNGFKSAWYKVSFKHNGKMMNGYVWGGLISMCSFTLPNNDIFLYGINKNVKEKGYESVAKLVRGGKIISSIKFRPIGGEFFDNGDYGHSVGGQILTNKGFSNVKNIFSISFTYEACGFANGEIYLFWDGKKLTYGVEAITVSEAGVFHVTTNLIFPEDEKGISEKLIVIETVENFNEDKDEYELSEEKKEFYRWTNEGMNKIMP